MTLQLSLLLLLALLLLPKSSRHWVVKGVEYAISGRDVPEVVDEDDGISRFLGYGGPAKIPEFELEFEAQVVVVDGAVERDILLMAVGG